jgi:hypothetical protein
MQTIHPNFNIDSTYFMCKQCGQVFQNRYKLSCHMFNVHSGKRKNRAKKTVATKTISSITQDLNNNNNNDSNLVTHLTDNNNHNQQVHNQNQHHRQYFSNQMSTDMNGIRSGIPTNENVIDNHVTSVINNVANGIFMTSKVFLFSTVLILFQVWAMALKVINN